MLFLIGILEMLIVTAWTKMVTETKVLFGGAVTIVNILIWYYVLQRIVDDIKNWQLVLLYAAGCAIGTMISTYYFSRREKNKLALSRLEEKK
jgi:ABC-type iron transport system FetAB permease component